MVSGGNQEAGSTAAGAKILIVDDDPDTLLGLTLILRKKGGHEVVAASDAIQAIMVAIRRKPISSSWTSACRVAAVCRCCATSSRTSPLVHAESSSSRRGARRSRMRP